MDAAGKTTLLYLLKENRFIQEKPTLHATSEELRLGNIVFETFDLGGHKQVRKIWSEYFGIADGIVFIIDAFDRKRFEEAKQELDGLLSSEQLNCPILILANKTDLPNAAGEQEIENYFNLNSILTGKNNYNAMDQRPIELFMCSMKYSQGYGDGFRWIANFFNLNFD